MRKYIKFILSILIISIILVGCLQTKTHKTQANTEIKNIIDIIYENNNSLILSKVEGDSFEFLLSGVDAENIEIPNKFMNITKNKEGKLLIAISTADNVKPGEVLLKIHSNSFNVENIDYYSRNSVTKEYYDIDPYNWKWGGLLGDFNLDGEVGLTDFASFVYYYGMEPWRDNVPEEFSRFDIGPALNISQKGIWSDIYDYKLEDWNVNIIDFSIFTANYGQNINSETPLGTITINSSTIPDSISTPTYSNIAYFLTDIPNFIHNLSNTISTHEDYISSILEALNNEDPNGLLLNLINMPPDFKNDILTLLEKLGTYAEKLQLNDYLYEDIKWMINDFDWNNDGVITNNAELHIEATVTYMDNTVQKESLGIYSDLILGDMSNIENIEFIGIDSNTPGDAILDWDLVEQLSNNGAVTAGYTPVFDENDYLLIDEGFVSMIDFILKNIYGYGNIPFLYNLTPTATVINILENHSFDASITELLLNMAKDDNIISQQELIDNIFGNMLTAESDFETRVSSIQHSFITRDIPIKYAIDDSITDYLSIPHDPTSGPRDLMDLWTLSDSKITKLFMTDINAPVNIGGPIMLYPAVFFENTEDFHDLGSYLPDITLEGTLNSEIPKISKITIDFPDPHFGDLVSGIQNPIIIENPNIFQPPELPSTNVHIIDFKMEGITRIPIPDEYGYVYPEIALRFDSHISSPENVSYAEIYKDNDYITDLYWIDEDYFYNEEYYDITDTSYLENSDYTLEVYDYSNTLVDSATLYLGILYPVDTFEVTNPLNNDTFNLGDNIQFTWNIPNNTLPYYEGAEINVFKYDDFTGDFDWENRIRVADDYDSSTPYFSMTDLSYSIPSYIFDTSGFYIIELVIYNWSDNTSFEYHVVINVQ
ncbi:hypothetical protein [Marinitoga aeolica]|uniref:Uncharacterized protein n=1 Tax=Marinitoga aeolica TaxID=2809031 RepID=A0ABY8PPE5_9BACT|nr:hypothetical protein [Marinitoga aeolica]WGS64499.1 hypothetical protein JRV97_08980 [Marinitoga aeolica]